MYEGDFLFWNPFLHEQPLQLRVHVEPLARRGGQVAEDQLRRSLRGRLLPYPEHLVRAGAHLALGMVGELRVEEPLVEGDLAPVVRDLEHVVGLRGHVAVAHLVGAFP